GIVEREHATARERDAVERDHGRVVHEGERAERERLRHFERLRDEQEVALVPAVGDEPRPRRQDEDRPELARRQQANGKAALRQMQDEQRQADDRQPVPAVGNELPEEEEPEVAALQRRERATGPRGTRFARYTRGVVGSVVANRRARRASRAAAR